MKLRLSRVVYERPYVGLLSTVDSNDLEPLVFGTFAVGAVGTFILYYVFSAFWPAVAVAGVGLVGIWIGLGLVSWRGLPFFGREVGAFCDRFDTLDVSLREIADLVEGDPMGASTLKVLVAEREAVVRPRSVLSVGRSRGPSMASLSAWRLLCGRCGTWLVPGTWRLPCPTRVQVACVRRSTCSRSPGRRRRRSVAHCSDSWCECNGAAGSHGDALRGRRLPDYVEEHTLSESSCGGFNADGSPCVRRNCSGNFHHRQQSQPMVVSVGPRAPRAQVASKKPAAPQADHVEMMGFVYRQAPELWKALIAKEISINYAYMAAQGGHRTVAEAVEMSKKFNPQG